MFSFIFAMAMVFTTDHIQMATAVDCDPNENNATCARDISCQPTCDNFQGTGCPHACDPTVCVCNDGFIRASSDNQTCIEKTQCTPICGNNEEYVSCASFCQPTCDGTTPYVCATTQCSPGCVCQTGYVRSLNAQSPCIQCPNAN